MDGHVRMSDTELVARIAEGDSEALAEAYHLHAMRVYRLALAITRSVTESEDIVHDIFVALPEALTAFRGEADLATWLHRVAVRSAIMRVRRWKTWTDISERFPEVFARPRKAPPVLDRVSLERAFAELPERYRAVLLLKDVEDWKHSEIAEALGITENASYVLLHRARRKLRHELGGRRRR